MTTALILGYSAFDLGLYNDKDPRLKVIKKAIQKDLESMAKEGVTWLVSVSYTHLTLPTKA